MLSGIAGHATPSGSFVTPKPVTRGQRGQRGGRSATPKTEPGSSGRRAAASVPRPRAASARTPRATPRTTAGPARRRRSATSDQSPDDTEGGSEGADVIETAARPRSAPVRVYARPGLRPTRMRPRSPSPNPVRTTRGRSAQKRVKVESPQPLLLPPEEALVQDTLSDVAAATGDQPADQPAEDVASARRDDLPGQGVSVPVQDAAVSWQLPQPHPPAAGSTEEHMMRAEKVQLEEHLHDNIPVAWPTSNGSAGPEEPGEPSISEVEKPAHDQRSLPSSSVRRSCENGDSVTTPAQASFKENAQDDPNVQPGNSPATANRKAEAADRSRRPRQGFLSLTAVEEGTAELAAAAVKRLRRLRMCPEGRDEMATHLIVGSQKRTLKVMLAIAKGAWLLSPAWLTASLEAGKWQDEQDFQAEVAYSAAAAAARLHYEQRKPPLLKGESLHIVEPDAQTPQTASRVAALKRTATAHGAEVTGLRSCTLCVVMHGSTRPHQSCEAVTEDWLLTLAETFALPPREAPFTLTSR
ncbi:hypothetical protein COCSUDRAFT_57988 [Coccomyxa subellipsoidea C-169]|uniref:BRCT domain-containing protein n=1 Tax=Coccomyxa subellipsoidea (strain C-169) TaxID=574566 RepID=I0YPF1_COCSC|nr:hypothetical protein COCSUDRAFT_57988 [Coccomyxa subellipsoidea C-169]EIE20270.1 hypothetical protein COCSUDRAFT_57988 [Coccomyxa subellipsoidea C-169]|eukprot:XP_005644814.1 hypothetical protein COCSUDRAFT_57988 [Coccomyxa subellipsoidea C-169]